MTAATGSFSNGSGLGLTVSEGQPDSRMQEWSPVQISSSTPKRVFTTRAPRLSFSACSTRRRRWRASMHSPSAMMTLSPRSAVRIASFSVVTILPTLLGADRSQPMHAERTQRPLDTDPGRGAGATGIARRQILLAGRGCVAVLHDDENAVALVEHVRGDAGTPLCQNPPSPMTPMGRLAILGATAAALASDMP